MVKGRLRLAALGLAALTCVAPAARAQSRDQAAAAQVLFDEAFALAEAGRYAEACPKFEESQRLDPGMGTQFRLAECYEKTGRPASAWSTYLEVVQAARRAGIPEREAAALARAQALEPNLPRLSITLSPGASATPGIEVRRNGALVGRQLLGKPVPVDLGEQVILASAPGMRPFQARVVATGGQTRDVVVPALVAAPRPAAPPAPGDGGSTMRAAGVVVGGIGLAGVAVGVVLGLRAQATWDDALARCDGGERTRCRADGVDLGGDAGALADFATVAFIAGGAAVAAGVVLFVAAPSTARPAERSASVRLAPAPAGARLLGEF